MEHVMRLATLRDGTRDGALLVIHPDGQRYALATDIAHNMQRALDAWGEYEPRLRARAAALEAGEVEAHPLDFTKLAPPLPRAYEWVDGSAYINHIVLVRKARGAEPPETLETDPLVYQGGSGVLLGPTQDIEVPDLSWGADFESEVCVVLGDTPVGTTADKAAPYVRLVMLANDVTYRNLIPPELAKGFGFFQSKPATAFSPFAVTPDELGDAWQAGRLHLPLLTDYNGARFGDPNAGPEMHFSFYDLIAHLTKTRAYTAGTILGSGTISNHDRARGSSCIAEVRMIEQIDHGKITTPFMKYGDTVHIRMFDASGRNIFGDIRQTVTAPR
jgi:fumarylacetoacetate (FAA) hydrolase